MPKIVLNNFSGGLADQDRNIPNNQFYIGDNVDIFRNEGYLTPQATNVAGTLDYNSSSTVLQGRVISGCVDSTNSKVYLMSDDDNDGGHLYEATINGNWNADFDGGGNKYKAITNFESDYGGKGWNDMAIYNCNLSSTLARRAVYTYNTASAAYLGSYPLTGTTFSLTHVTLTTTGVYGAANESYKSPHPMHEWNTYLWIGNGRYVTKYDGVTGANGTATLQALDLGASWEITALFSTNNYLGICAWKKGADSVFTESRVFFWNGTSSTYTYSIPIKDNKITAAKNYNGVIYISTATRYSWGQIGILTENGFEPWKKLYFTVNDTLQTWSGPTISTMAVCQNRLFIGESARWSSVLSIGSETTNSKIITLPIVLSSNQNDWIGFLSQVGSNNVFIGWRDATNSKDYLYTINPLTTTYSTAAYKAGYTDFGQRVKVNYVKFYFKPLVSGDSLNVGLDVDYTNGTATSLGTITYTADGAVSSKKFVKPFTCHAFRPTITWATGGTPASKIVVDYNFISD